MIQVRRCGQVIELGDKKSRNYIVIENDQGETAEVFLTEEELNKVVLLVEAEEAIDTQTQDVPADVPIDNEEDPDSEYDDVEDDNPVADDAPGGVPEGAFPD